MEVALMNRNTRARTKDVLAALQPLLAGPLRDAGSEDDVNAFVVLCCMSAIPSGTEDPKGIVRGMSDKFVETVKLGMCEMMKNRVASQVAQFFFMEWCFRHGHLEEDWQWTWKSKTEGDLRYREKIPLQTLSGFSN